MPKINLNSVSPSVFMVNAANDERADIVSKGRVLFYEHAANGKSAIMAANGLSSAGVQHMLTPKGYKELNEKFPYKAISNVKILDMSYIGDSFLELE